MQDNQLVVANLIGVLSVEPTQFEGLFTLHLIGGKTLTVNEGNIKDIVESFNSEPLAYIDFYNEMYANSCM